MRDANHRTLKNHLLSGLSYADFALLGPYLKPIELHVRTPLVLPMELIQYSWFPESGIVSVVTPMPDGRQVEAGIIGREGMVDTATVNGVDRSSLLCFVQVAGMAYRLPSAELQRAMAASKTLRTRLAQYAHVMTVQIAHTAFANAANTIEQRLARWLLMASDRASENAAVAMTHEFLSVMLGVRRSGVTIAVNDLVHMGAITARRGSIAVLDRAQLIALCKGSYGPPEAEYARLFGATPATTRANNGARLAAE